jgi:hypothetical protein
MDKQNCLSNENAHVFIEEVDNKVETPNRSWGFNPKGEAEIGVSWTQVRRRGLSEVYMSTT